MERESGLADPSGWWRLSVAEEGFLATEHPRTRLAAAAEVVHYRQTGPFLKAAGDLPPGVVDQLAAATGADPNGLEGWLWSSRTSRQHRALTLAIHSHINPYGRLKGPCCTDGARKRGDTNFAWVYAIRT